MSAIREALATFQKSLVRRMVTSKEYKQAKAFGEFQDFVQSNNSFELTEQKNLGETTSVRLVQYGPAHTPYIDKGRGATTNGGDGTLYKRIYKWVALKKYGIAYSNDKQRKSIAFAITRKIHKRGTYRLNNPTYMVENAIQESIEELNKALGEAYQAEAIKKMFG